jgi:crotonobetainyl-CoA:carnitine CoA-transferase CaiB-like acyl-CoA transferase
MLSPYRVLDLTDGGALLCGQILGDLGADVVVIEPPGGAAARKTGPFYHGEEDPDKSLDWWALNRNKRGITLDLESPAGRQRFLKLAAAADFLIESRRPGDLDRLGLGYGALLGLNPRLVMVSITPFGQNGPKANWAATDLTCLAASGTLLMNGDDDRAPVAVAVPQAFLHAGAEAAAAALIAHTGRERDGLGQHVDVSVQAAAMMATQATVLSAAWGDRPTKRLAGGVNYGGIPLRFVNPAADGFVSVTFLFGSAIGPFSRRLLEVMYEEGVVDEATRDKDWINYTTLLVSGQEPLSELMRCLDAIGRFTARHTRAELFEMAMRRGLLIVPVNTTADVVNSEQLAARRFWTGVEHPELGATVTYPGPLARFHRTPIAYRLRPPLLGEHNDEVAPAPARAIPVAAGDGERKLPLAGVKVADFMWVAAGPWGIRYLADYGATVVHVESTTRIDTARTLSPFKDGQPGPERSGVWATLNAGKLGLTLNLASPGGHEVALRLARWADVLTESFAPGTARKLGLDYEALRLVNPGLVMISSCLNGQDGPHAGLAGFGTMGSQLAGFGYLAGWPDRPPAGAMGAYTDYIAPKLTAAAILAALDHRRRTGEGQYIDFSQGEASGQFLAPALLDYTVNGRVWERAGNASPECAPHGVYPAAGTDRWVAIVAAEEAQWRALCEAIGHTPWLSDPRFSTLEARLANRDALDAALGEWTSARAVHEIEEVLQAARVPVHRASGSEDVLADPQLAARRHFIDVEHPEFGAVTIENSRVILSATRARVTAAGPAFGQHNEHVLRDLLGYSEEEVVELVAGGALE